MKQVLYNILGFLARAVIRRHKPRIVAITGSVGKTSTKQAVTTVLSSHFTVGGVSGGYNNELGVPLAVIGAAAPGRNPLAWLRVILLGLRRIVGGAYPEILVLEFGADKPGDINRLMRLYPPNVGVLTAIAPVHLEKFKTLENVAREKKLVISLLGPHGRGVASIDDPLVFKEVSGLTVPVLGYGTSERADVVVEDIRLTKRNGPWGLNFKIHHKDTTVPIFLPGIVAEPQAWAAAAAAAVGLVFGLNLVDCGQSLLHYKMPPGRGRLLKGVSGSMIIDDSYNASSRSTVAALQTLDKVSAAVGGRRLAILGDMLELGLAETEAHEEVGRETQNVAVDILITIGNRASIINETAGLSGMPAESRKHFDDSQSAIDYVRPLLKADDVVLVKGSQGARLEHVVKALLAYPETASGDLPRQNKRWLQKK